MKLTELKCKNCGAQLKIKKDQEEVVCEFCNSAYMVEDLKKDPEVQEVIVRHVHETVDNTFNSNKLAKKGILFGIIVFFAILIGGFAIAYKNLKTVDVFKYMEVEFHGKNTYGSVDISFKENDENITTASVDYSIDNKAKLRNGDKITVTITSTPEGTKPKERKKTFTVSGLNEYMSDVSILTEEEADFIHQTSKTQLDKVLKSTVMHMEVVSHKPYKMYLLSNGVDKNLLYDIYEVVLKRENGKKITLYAVIYYEDIVVYKVDEMRMDYYNTMYESDAISTDDYRDGVFSGFRNLDDIKTNMFKGQDSSMKFTER